MKKSIFVVIVLVTFLSACNWKPNEPNIIIPEESFDTRIVFSVLNKNSGEAIVKNTSDGSVTGTFIIDGVVHNYDYIDSLNAVVGDTLVLSLGLEEVGYWIETDSLSVSFLLENWCIDTILS